MTESNQVLPHVLSELAQMALDDLTTVVPARGLGVDLNRWCSSQRSVCTVCAGGAVMVSRLGLDVSKGESYGHDWLVREFGSHNALALVAIDSLRDGNVGTAAAILGESSFDPWLNEVDEEGDSRYPHRLNRPMPQAFGDIWIAAMRDLIVALREAGQ